MSVHLVLSVRSVRHLGAKVCLDILVCLLGLGAFVPFENFGTLWLYQFLIHLHPSSEGIFSPHIWVRFIPQRNANLVLIQFALFFLKHSHFI